VGASIFWDAPLTMDEKPKVEMRGRDLGITSLANKYHT
jgi:hypothetical protein